MQTETEIQKLIALLKDPDRDVRHATIVALGKLEAKWVIPDPDCAAYLIDLLNDLDDDVR